MKSSSISPATALIFGAFSLVIFSPLATAEEASLTIKSITPASPAKLNAGEKLTIAIDYSNPASRPVQIWARPYTNGHSTPGYGAHGSPMYDKPSGSLEGWFTFRQPSAVDEVRVEMVENSGNSATRRTLATATLPIKAQWVGTIAAAAGSATPSAARPTIPPAKVSLGEVLDIKFTAVDGREVDLAKMRGKVVLIDFWATWCGPCVGELPHVLEAYQKFHDKGFEIVGISFDQDKGALERMTKDRGMAWPQFFDGTGWKNQFGVKYSIHGIPTMWLLDKEGRVASTTARRDLAGQVEALLAGKTLTP